MSSIEQLLDKPNHLSGTDHLFPWFTEIAQGLLDRTRLMIGSAAHRFVEVEFYYFGDGHQDPFTHRDPLQLEMGRWYFHRTNGVYRSGSFKGMDLTFGHDGVHGGVLIRGLEKPDGELVDGPSLCVDYLLEQTGHAAVSALDRAVNGRVVWDEAQPLVLQATSSGGREVLPTARVGLSMKKATAKTVTEMGRYIMRRYRFLSDPKRTAKGKLHMILSLHAEGCSIDEIMGRVGGTRSAIQRYLADFDEGKQAVDFQEYVGQELGPKELCRLHGTHARVNGS